jgi:ABC-type lipoprotein export system ATPase subunit
MDTMHVRQSGTDPQGSLIRLERVSRIFNADGVETAALSGIDLSIEAGEYVAIAGPSGCGKTTLLSILGLLDIPTAGTYFLEGERVSSLSIGERARVRIRHIADEPTGNMDSDNGGAVMGLLDELHGDGATICMVTHDPRYADRAERAVELFDGSLATVSLRDHWDRAGPSGPTPQSAMTAAHISSTEAFPF